MDKERFLLLQKEKGEKIKDCSNCKYTDVPEHDQPCCKCCDSFCGNYFPPWNWEAKVNV